MYYLLFGENSYAIGQKVSALKAKFLEADPSGLNLLEMEGASLTWNDFTSAVMTLPFLAEKRLVIIKNLLLENGDNELKKGIADHLDKIPASSIVFFVETGLPDGRSALFRALNKPKIAQEFKAPTARDFLNLLEQNCKSAGISIRPELEQKLSFILSNDPGLGQLEIEKLILYVQSQGRGEIEGKDIELLVQAQNPINIFDFVDAVANKNLKKAFINLSQLLAQNNSETYILSMIVYQFRILLIIFDLLGRNLSEPQIAKEAKLHPFVVKKSISLAKKYNKDELIRAYGKLREADFSIKTGGADPKIALTMLTYSLSSNSS